MSSTKIVSNPHSVHIRLVGVKGVHAQVAEISTL
jgi:hypothetical protein